MLRRALTEIDLSVYAEAAMLIFLIVFIAIAWRVWTLGSRLDVDAAARMPLGDDDAGGVIDDSTNGNEVSR